MARCIKHEPCPKCSKEGRDSRGDNLGVYDDGSSHCFSCGFHSFPSHWTPTSLLPKIEDGRQNKGVLPRDFTREVPASAWKWLLQWGLSYRYWKPFTGYSPAEERVVLTVGTPTKFSIGRYLGIDPGEKDGRGQWIRRPPKKWYIYGDRHSHVEIVGEEKEGPVVLVEDLISAHKVGQVVTAICLFGTSIQDAVVKKLQAFKRPVTLWLDADQYTLLPKKINRLQAFLEAPVGYIKTEQDPKKYTLDEIKHILGKGIDKPP